MAQLVANHSAFAISLKRAARHYIRSATEPEALACTFSYDRRQLSAFPKGPSQSDLDARRFLQGYCCHIDL